MSYSKTCKFDIEYGLKSFLLILNQKIMKTQRPLFMIALILVLGFQGMAQTDHQKAASSIDFTKLGMYVPGTLYFKNGTIEKYDGIEYQNPEKLKKLDNTLFYNKPGQMARASVSQTDLDAFEIGKNKWVIITHGGEKQFGIIHIDGAIKDYSVFRIPVARVTGDYVEERYIRKLDAEPISNGAFMLKFKKHILEMVADDTELIGKINAGEKGYKSFINSVKIVTEYNEWHKTKYPELYK
jgi:hypothetical protein